MMNATAEPQVHFGLPPATLFQFPPSGVPDTLPAPQGEPTWMQPFSIPPNVYNSVLDVRVPITVAAVYATTVVLLNKVNKRGGNKPWAISRTRAFKVFVILHNVFLAVYSVWTCVGMAQALYNSFTGGDKEFSPLALADSMCKINGPRGFGNAATFDSQTGLWGYNNPELRLGEGGAPDSTDVGRLWNQGLAFYGWIFYLSKFYEVLDTVIILAKGKRSSTLQTYHHAGAMMCMWAGIRYMASPIWIFALVNSGIHALMYTYYTLTALSVRVPTRVKRTLTTMQITQFVIGTFMAASHLFVRYDIPAMIPYEVVNDRYLASIPSPVSSIAESVTAVATAGMLPWFKKLALRAAGAEGIAENVVNDNGLLFGSDSLQVARAAKKSQGIRYVQGYRTVNCMDNSGQAFAVWLNVMYLLPLTYLFARFFVRSYLRRAESRSKDQPHSEVIENSGLDALKGVRKELSNAIMEMHGDEGTSSRGSTTPDVGALEKLADDVAVEADKGFTKVPESKAAPATTATVATPSPKSKKRKNKGGKNATAAQANNPFEVLSGDENEKDVSVQS